MNKEIERRWSRIILRLHEPFQRCSVLERSHAVHSSRRLAYVSSCTVPSWAAQSHVYRDSIMAESNMERKRNDCKDGFY